MTLTPDQHFERYRRGDAAALGAVFDALAPELLLVAAHLAGGDVAEDLVQATFLDAIRLQDRWDEKRPLVPWLVGILGNHLRETRRQGQRVLDPRRLALREVEGPDTDAQAAELIETVHAAVERLSLPYRQVLLLRFVHGLELQQIAHSLGVPLGTVKTQVHRGTVLLRRALPAGLASAFAVLLTPGRGLAAVREVVLGHAKMAAGTAAGSAAAVAAGSLFGALIMKKALLAVGLVLAVAGGWFAFTASPPIDTAVPQPQPRQEPVAAGIPSPAVPPTPPDAATQQEPAAAAARELVATTASVEVEVVWESDGAPVAGARIRLHQRGFAGAGTKVTDEAGRVAWHEVLPGNCVIQSYRGAEPARITIEAGGRVQHRLVLAGELRLRCIVVDAAGEVQPGAAVWCTDLDSREELVRLLGTTDAGGVLRHRGFALGGVWARKPGQQPSRSITLGNDVKGEHEVRLVLGAAGCELIGVVVDPGGRPVPEALVVLAQDESIAGLRARERAVALHAICDASGRFRLDELPAGEYPIVAAAQGFAAASARVQTQPEAAAVVTLHLLRGATVEGRVLDRDGNALVGANVRASSSAGLFPFVEFQERLGGWLQTKVDGDGRYRVAAIRPGAVELDFSVVLRGSDVSTSRKLTLGDGEQKTVDLTLPEGLGIAGRVVDADDRPVAGWQVRLLGASASPRWIERSARTDEVGAFRFEGLREMSCRVAVFDPEARGAAAHVSHAAADNVHPGALDLLLRVPSRADQRAWLTGRVVWPAGERGKVSLSLYPKPHPRGGFIVPTEELDAGIETFRIGPLPPGSYDLLCDVEGRTRQSQHGLVLAAGQTLELPPFSLDGQRELRLRLRHADGRPVTGAVATLQTEGGPAPCTEHAPGDYRSPPVAPGRYTMQARGIDFAPLRTEVDVGPDPDAVVEQQVQPARTVTMRFTPADGALRGGGLRVWVYDARGTELVHDTLQVEPRARFDLQLGLLPGRYSLRADALSAAGRATQEFVVAAGDGPHAVDIALQVR